MTVRDKIGGHVKAEHRALGTVGHREDRRRLRTRSALITAGHKLFAARSIDCVSIDEIIGIAEVAKGSFYNHFPDKESLADTIVKLVQADCERHIFVANQDVGDAAARVARALAIMLGYARDHPDRLKAMLSLSARRTDVAAPLNAGVTHDIKAGLAGGQFKNISAEAGVLIVLGLISVAIDYLKALRSVRSAPDVAFEMGGALLRALGCEPELAEQVAREAAKLALEEVKNA